MTESEAKFLLAIMLASVIHSLELERKTLNQIIEMSLEKYFQIKRNSKENLIKNEDKFPNNEILFKE